MRAFIRTPIPLLFAFCLVALPGPSAASPTVNTVYERGVERFHAGDYDAAATAFERAISLDPEPDGATAYMPYLYLSASQFQLGNSCSAHLAFRESEAIGEAAGVPYGRVLIDHYRTTANAGEGLAAPVAAPGGGGATERLRLSQARVLQRCRYLTLLEGNAYPWYFHYLLGLELDSAGDAHEALDSMLMGANLRQNPERGKRVYGMHFVDYLPYFQIARLHARLEDWPRAREALKLSRELGEFTPEDPDFDRFDALETKVAANLGSAAR